jgi:hypothetical protein
MIYHTDKEYLKYLVAILNSKAANFFYINFYCGGVLGKSGIRFKKEFLLQLPIPSVSYLQQSSVVSLVEKILDIKKKESIADTSSIERHLDNIIYKLYNLTYNEVKVIEPDFPLNIVEYEKI